MIYYQTSQRKEQKARKHPQHLSGEMDDFGRGRFQGFSTQYSTWGFDLPVRCHSSSLLEQ